MGSNTSPILVTPDMKLQAHVGSDRSWVWNAAADVSEGEPESLTLAILAQLREIKASQAASSTQQV